MSTDQHRLVMIATILGMVVLLVVGALIVVQPQLAAAGVLDEQRAALEQQSAATRDRIAHLQEQGEDLPALEEQLDELRAAIPATLDSSAYIDALGRLADSTGVSVTSITVADGQAYAAPPPPADGAATQPGIVTDARITSENFVVIPVSLGVSGSWSQVLRFLDGLQGGSRLFLVTNLSIGSAAGGEVLAQIGGFIYALPGGAVGNPDPDSFPEVEPTPAPTPEETEMPVPEPTPSGTPAP